MKEQDRNKVYEEIDRILTERGAKEEDIEEFNNLHLVAALRDRFTVESLSQDAQLLGQEANAEEVGKTVEDILSDSRFFLAEGGTEMQWEYRQERKRNILQKAIPDGRALAVSRKLLENGSLGPREEAVQRILEGDLEFWRNEEDLPSLRMVLEAVNLLRGLVEVPSTADIRRHIAWREILDPFRVLTDCFAGRKEELRTLREYVDFLPPEDIREGVKRVVFRGLEGIRRMLSLHEHPLLAISGIGGVGKSALVSKFILDHVSSGSEPVRGESMTFVYIDYDHRTVSLQDPMDILREAARQLALQLPDFAADFTQLEQQVNSRSRIIDRNPGGATKGNPFQYSSPTRSGDSGWQKAQFRQGYRSDKVERTDLLEDLGRIWNGLPDKVTRAPFMLVLDSFEEVHRFGDSIVLELFNFLRDWSEVMPRFRPVLVGRTPVDNLPIKPRSLHLREFDPESAMAYLSARGVGDEETARYVVRQFGRHPLSLKLAVELIEKSKKDGEGLGMRRKRGLFRQKVDTQLAQNDLFQRNLAHIHDPSARKIAFPGLVLRQISPQIIREVLAGPCGLGEVDEEEVLRLFDVLAKETFLVSKAGNGNLQFRKDLRQLVLPYVLSQDPTRTRAIQEAAIAYYGNRPALEDRAEYAYHRLLRGDQPQELEKELMQTGMLDYLQGSLDELPTEAHLFLASRWSIPVPPEIKEKADLEAWENNLASELDSAIQSGFFEETLRLYMERLEERQERSRLSPLPLREARLCLELGDFERMEEALELAEAIANSKDDEDEILRINGMKAGLLERTGRYEEELKLMDFFLEKSELPHQVTNALANWLRVWARTGRDWADARATVEPMLGKLDRLCVERPANTDFSVTLLKSVLLPYKALIDPSFSARSFRYIDLPVLLKSQSLERHGPPGIEESIALIHGPSEQLAGMKFFLNAEEFASALSASGKTWPDESALSEAAQEIFNDRLGNLVDSNIYVTALHTFLMKLELYGRWDAIPG